MCYTVGNLKKKLENKILTRQYIDYTFFNDIVAIDITVFIYQQSIQ